ncbi:MAG: tetratricopeptide repeat protein [Anaerolineales bacterium]|nr:tetratricopeptide repeat protein [Anaerolineales bacterium]
MRIWTTQKELILQWIKILLPVILVMLLGISPISSSITREVFSLSEGLQEADWQKTADGMVFFASIEKRFSGYWEKAGEAYLLGGDGEKALAAYSSGQELRALSKSGYVQWVELSLMDFTDSEKVPFLLNTIRAYPDVPGYYLRLSDLYRESGDFPSELESLSDYLVLAPDDIEAAYRQGLLLSVYNPEKAIDVLYDVSINSPAHQVVAGALRRSIQQALAFEDVAYQYTLIGQELGSLGEWQLSKACFSLAVEANKEYAEARAYLGEAKYQLGEDGGEDILAALLVDPTSFSANLFMGLHQKRAGNYASALRYFKIAQKIQPDIMILALNIAETTGLGGDLEGGIALYKKIIDETPSSTAEKAYVSFLINTQVNLEEEALPVIQTMLETTPLDDEVWILQGQLYALLDKKDESMVSYLRAVEINPENATAFFQLGILYLSLNQQESARQAFETVLELSPNTVLGDEAEYIIKEYLP